MEQMTQWLSDDRTSFIERMVGVVSHDLRTPLTAIRMGVDILRTAELDPALSRMVSRMNQATQRAQRLIQDLLDFTEARLGGRLPLVSRPIDIHACVDEALAEMSLAFPGAHFVHVRNNDGGCVGDHDRLVQALANLVANAVVYGEPGRTITVTSAVTYGTDGPWCSLSVHNQGTAIPALSIPTLFEPLVRGGSRLRAPGSIGLGLFIVREIAKAHLGSVAVSSSDDQGTIFTMRFPIPERRPYRQIALDPVGNENNFLSSKHSGVD